MITIIAALVFAPAALTSGQASVVKYQGCLAPIVRANELAPRKDRQPLEAVLGRIKAECSTERAAAREALSQYVATNRSNDARQPNDAEKEELIHEATVRWANGVVHNLIAQLKD